MTPNGITPEQQEMVLTPQARATLYRKLTGREPDPEDLKAAERTMADVQAKIAAFRAQRAPSNSQKEGRA